MLKFDGANNKYLLFHLGQEEFGIPILRVKEIIGMLQITQVPKTAHYIKGVINLRGKIIPVMDLRLKFGQSERAYDARTCLVVVEIKEQNKTIAIAIDSVSEVATIQKNDIETPSSLTSLDTQSLQGVAKIKDRVVLLLDIDSVVLDQDLISHKQNQELGDNNDV